MSEVMDNIYKLAPIRPASESDSGGFSGYASTFNFLDYHNDIIAKGAYTHDLARFLQKGFIGGVGHDHANPIGRPVELFEDAKGLWLVAHLIDTTKAQDDRKLIVSGVVKELSVGIIPMQVKRLRTRTEVESYWKSVGWIPSDEEIMRAENGARLIKRAKLLEISPVAMGANEQTEIRSFKAGRRFSKASTEILVQVCQQVKTAYETLETVLTEAGVKSEEDDGEDDAEAEGAPAGPEFDPMDEILSAFREFLATRS